MDNSLEIDLENITTSEDLHSLLKAKLDFPEFYGRNLNAFWDSITGLVELPAVIVLKNWKLFEAKLPADAQIMKECFDKMTEEYPSLSSQIKYL